MLEDGDNFIKNILNVSYAVDAIWSHYTRYFI